MDKTRLTLRLSAAVYALGYFTAMFLPSLPEAAYTDSRVTSLLTDSGERTPIVVAGYALAVSGIAFLVFASVLAGRLADAGESLAARITQSAGTAYGVVVAIAGTFFASIPMGVGLGELPDGLDPALFRAESNAGFYALLLPGLLAAAAVVIACSVGLRSSQAVPRWCTTAGFVVAPLLLLGLAWVPQFLVPLWALAVAGAFTVDVSRDTGHIQTVRG